eukprot:scaffold50923_cov62-Phaeocystis_antarctica.AAC.2
MGGAGHDAGGILAAWVSSQGRRPAGQPANPASPSNAMQPCFSLKFSSKSKTKAIVATAAGPSRHALAAAPTLHARPTRTDLSAPQGQENRWPGAPPALHARLTHTDLLSAPQE